MSRRPVVPLAALATSFGIIALLLNSPLVQPSPRSVGGTTRREDEAAIYGLLIDSLFGVFGGADSAILDDSSTPIGTGDFARRPSEVPDKSFASALADYIEQNQTGRPIDLARIPVHHNIRRPLPGERLMGSRHRLTIGLSRVGFDPGGTRAVVYFAFGCGALCAQGDIVWLKRGTSGEWQIALRQMLWVS